MLSLSDVNAHYGQAHILRDVTLAVGEGEVVALLGRNGAGKSTMMKTIMGGVAATSGELVFRGKRINHTQNYQRARLGLGYVPEDRRIFKRLTVLENLEAGRRTPNYPHEPWTLARIYQLFPKLDELKKRLGGQLSGGEQQMLTMARTLMTNPCCLLLDEPTEGLAPIVVKALVEGITMLKKQGLSLFISEQNKHFSSSLADKVYVLEKGAIVYEGPYQGLTPIALKAIGWV